jgi:sulfite reductase beta subunit-like hemoprotein
MRMTVEQDVIFPNVPEKNLEAMQQEPMFQRLVTSLWACITPVSCMHHSNAAVAADDPCLEVSCSCGYVKQSTPQW